LLQPERFPQQAAQSMPDHGVSIPSRNAESEPGIRPVIFQGDQHQNGIAGLAAVSENRLKIGPFADAKLGWKRQTPQLGAGRTAGTV
jgi:hypothetical protein